MNGQRVHLRACSAESVSKCDIWAESVVRSRSLWLRDTPPVGATSAAKADVRFYGVSVKAAPPAAALTFGCFLGRPSALRRLMAAD